MNAAEVIRAVRDLPSLPSVVNELLATMDQEDIDTQALAAKITRDQALTAKTLRLANSSFYGLPSKVTSIQQAVAVLGFHSIRTLVTACSLTGSFSAGGNRDFDFPAFWRHAIATAAAARVLAPHARQSPETAFTAGLLHDLGTLVLVTRFPDAYRAVSSYQRQHDCLSAVAQQAIFGLDHAAVGSALAAHWKFPATIQAAVAEHHGGGGLTVPGTPLSLSGLIALANVLAHALDLAAVEDEQAPPLPLPLWQALALDEPGWRQVFRATEQLFNDMSQTLTP